MDSKAASIRRKRYIKAILSQDIEALNLLEKERAGTALSISSLEEEESYLMSIYKAVMDVDESAVERLPAVCFVNGYQSHYLTITSKLLSSNQIQ